ACSGTGSCTVTLNSNQSVLANFGPPPTPQSTVTIVQSGSTTGGTISSNPAGITCGASGTTCTANFDDGTTLTLTATPQPGYAFTGWTGSVCAGTGPCVISVNSNET